VKFSFNGGSGSVDFIQSLVNLSFVFLKEGSDETVIDNSGTHGLGIEQIDIEDELSKVVQRNQRQNHSENAIQEVQQNKDNPVSEPLDIIIRFRAFQGLERHVSGVQKADKSSDKVGAKASNDQEQAKGERSTNNMTGLNAELLRNDHNRSEPFEILAEVINNRLNNIKDSLHN